MMLPEMERSCPHTSVNNRFPLALVNHLKPVSSVTWAITKSDALDDVGFTIFFFFFLFLDLLFLFFFSSVRKAALFPFFHRCVGSDGGADHRRLLSLSDSIKFLLRCFFSFLFLSSRLVPVPIQSCFFSIIIFLKDTAMLSDNSWDGGVKRFDSGFVLIFEY